MSLLQVDGAPRKTLAPWETAAAGACVGHTGNREGGLTLWLGLGRGRRKARHGDRNSL